MSDTKSTGGEGYLAASVDVDRAFVRVKEGLIHYRHAGSGQSGGQLPIYMVHAGPGSSAGLSSLIAELGRSRRVVAPDTLGNGDSATPGIANPNLDYYADSAIRVMDALKLDKVDYFGTHTGAHIGVELLLTRPDRVRRAIFDGIGMFPEDLKAAMLENYAPEIKPQAFGEHLVWAWHFVRDQSLYFPYFFRSPKYKLNGPVPPPDLTHRSVVEVIKSITTYHNGYRAVFRHDTKARLAMVKHAELMLMASEPDPLHVYLDEAAALVPRAKKVLISRAGGLAARVKAMKDFYSA